MADAEHDDAHLTTEQIEARLDWLKASPADSGALEGICIRPKVNEREELKRCLLSPEGGVEGDFWAEVSWRDVKNLSQASRRVLLAMRCPNLKKRSQSSEMHWHRS